MNPKFPKVLSTALFALWLLLPLAAQPDTTGKAGFVRNIPELLKMAEKSQMGNNAITIVMQAKEVAQLFPMDPKKRAKADFKAALTDGRHVFLGAISPGGQSSLTVTTPNLRVSDLEEIRTPGVPSGKNSVSALVGVPIIDKTLRLNPMTMDEGYISTLTYIELINHFKLLPSSRLPLFGEYAKVVYRFVDEKDQWAQAVSPTDGRPLETIVAGLHLANFHPLKYLKEIDSDEAKILCIARSRYNVLNKVERLKSMFGKPIDENRREVFSSSDVKTEKTAPFRVEIKWAKKTSAEKEAAKPDEETKNAALLKELLVKVYSAPVRLRGKELYDELKSSLDLPQLFRFMALNRILENGDISDEYFWYVEKKEKTGKVSLGIMPQDGDDMFKGAHFFPTSPKQIGLIINSSGLAKKLKLGFGYIMNYEDPLFRVTQDDPYLFYQYLLVFEQVAGEIANSPVLEKILGRISTKIEPFSRDPEVLARGKTDERGREYSPESFIENIGRLKLKIRENAAKSFARLHGSAKDRGDLDRAKGAVGKF